MIRNTLLSASLVAFAAVAFSPVDASACGGFFCDGGGPQGVNQAAERIIFAQHPDGSVTSVIQIIYQGPPDRFGWLLPVPGIPEIGISSDAAFSLLQSATNPQYTMTTRVEGECRVETFENNGATVDAGSFQNNGTNNLSANDGGGVTVVAQGGVGPYNYVVIQIDAADEGTKAQLALDWLEENSYQVPEGGPELLDPYLDENYNLLAVKLQKSSDDGSVRPITLKYVDDHPMIPIKLTAVAATDDMGVMTWVLGESRAVPVNYKTLEINDALLNWFSPTSNYNDVIIAAANEASGQGFVTEWAQPTDQVAEVVFSTNDRQTWESFETADWNGNEIRYMDQVISTYRDRFFDAAGQWDGIADAIDAAFPTLTTQDRDTLLNCGAGCLWQDVSQLPTGWTKEDFLTAFDDFVVAPMRDTQELIDTFDFATRMYTTLSPEEMTLDPSFDFNPDLEPVSNIHQAERIIECAPHLYQWEAPWRAELPSGLVVRGIGNGWPITQDEMMPATLAVTEESTSGEGEVVRDNYETVRERLELANAEVVAPGPDDVDPETGEPMLDGKKVGGGSGCSTVDAAGASSLWLGLLGLFGLRRRRR